MKRVFSLIVLMILVIFFSGVGFAEEKHQNDEKDIIRYRKFFGKYKEKTGEDYSAQSTAGVEGGAKEGLTNLEKSDTLENMKKDLYIAPIKTIENLNVK